MDDVVENLTLEELKEKFRSLLEITKCAVCLESVRQEVVQCVNGHLICADCKENLTLKEKCLDSVRQEELQCENGHILCLDCKADLKICPTCQNNFSSSKPSHVVIQGIEILPTRCKNGICPTILTNDDDHEKYCGFKPTYCKLCSWEGPAKDIWYHCVNDHTSVAYKKSQDRTLSKFGIDDKLSLFTACGMFQKTLFYWEQTINDPDTKTFTKKWHLVPNGKPTFEFFVTLSFESESGPSSTTLKIKLNLDPDAPSEDNSISVPHKLLSNFIDKDSDLKYSIVKSTK